METGLVTARKHIIQIRSEFDIGHDKTRIFESLNESILHLSESLYQKDTHFILELIQNAEDNQYLPNIDPDLTFYFFDQDQTDTPEADGLLLIVNNEIGFHPDHVSAICTVGGSTKKDKRKGYIGEKGIGFKSVFTVTSQPFIFSGEYQFKFQDSPDPELVFRYIVPSWVENRFALIAKYSGKTCILLPLKRNKKSLVREQLQQIAPETILFLKKLRGLHIKINDKDTTEVIRSDQNKPIVEVITVKGEATYWLIEKEFNVPPVAINEKREGIESRIVSVAFPLLSSFQKTETVFAFLPTNVNSGFNFLVNADFILATNREGIRENLAWNLWLRDCIVQTFIESFVGLLHNSKYKYLPYQFIPLIESSRDLFFQPTAVEILNKLKTSCIVWIFNGRTLKEPGSTRFASKDIRQLLVSKPLPDQLTITPFIHPELEKDELREQLEFIGVIPLSDKEFISCLMDNDWINRRHLDWFYKLYLFLSKKEWATSKSLNNLSIVPTKEGEKVCGHTNWIYFPSKQSLEISKAYPEIIQTVGLKYFDRNLYNRIKTKAPLLEWVKNTLGVEELNLNTLCKHLTDRLSEDACPVDTKILIKITRFIRDHFIELDDRAKQHVKTHLPLLLIDGIIEKSKPWSDSHPLVVPPCIDPIRGWQLLFSDIEDRTHLSILSDSYLEDESSEGCSKWLKFFLELGATEYPPLQKYTAQFSPGQIPLDTMDHIKNWFFTRGWRLYTFNNWKAPKWLKHKCLNPTESVNVNKSLALLNWLEYRRNYGYEVPEDRIYVTYSTKKYSYYISDPCLSEFAYCIYNTAWLPSTKGLEIPGRVFVDKPETREFFKNLFPYTKQLISEGVIKYLKIKTSATTEEIIVLLRDITSNPAQNADPKLVNRIYSFLSERWDKSIQEEFSNNAWILSTKPSPEWINLKRAIWVDLPLGFDGIAYVDLSSQYNEKFYTFFVKQLGIPDKLEDESYAQAYINLSRLITPKPNLVESALEKIFPILLKVAKNQNKPDWWEGFVSEVSIWTQNDQFIPPSEVFIPDDGELQRRMGKVGIQFAWRPQKDSFSDYFVLYTNLGVKSLSDSVIVTACVKQEHLTESSNLNLFLTNDAKKTVCYYLRNSAGTDPRKLYETLKSDGKILMFLKTYEEEVSLLNTTFSLIGRTAHENDAATFWDQDNYKLYRSIQHSRDELEIEIPSAIARRFVNIHLAKDMENFIGRTLGCSPEKADRIIQKHNWSMPEDELLWIESNLTHDYQITGSFETDVAGVIDGVANIGNGGVIGVADYRGDTGEIGETGDKGDAGDIGYAVDISDKNKPSDRQRQRDGHKTSDGHKPSGEGSWRPRMGSYVENYAIKVKDEEDDNSERSQQIGEAGIQKVIAYETSQGRNPRYLGQNHEGWDIDSEEESSEGVNAILGIKSIRRIEVKSKEYLWDGWGIGLTSPEYKMAQFYGEDYYLYVVENALDPTDIRPPYIIHNPIASITDYRFDEKWKKLVINKDDSHLSND